MDWTELLAALSNSQSPLAIGVAVLLGGVGVAIVVTAITTPIYWQDRYAAWLNAQVCREKLDAELIAKGFQKEYVSGTDTIVWRKAPPR